MVIFGDGNYTISGGITMGSGSGTVTGPNNQAVCASPPTFETVFGNGTSFIVTDQGISMGGGCMVFGNAATHDINGGGGANETILVRGVSGKTGCDDHKNGMRCFPVFVAEYANATHPSGCTVMRRVN